MTYFAAQIATVKFERRDLNDEALVGLYRAILKPRMIEEKMLKLLRQGKVSKWFAGIGQEAIAVGSTSAMEDREYILPMHRNLGVFTTRQIPLEKLFKQFQGKEAGFTKGRDRSFHFGTQDYNIVGMISHLGPQMGVADGIALAHKLKNEKAATLVFSGEGGTSEGDFHEALNVAAVWDLPVIFLIENNGYGLSTPTNEQYRCEKISDRALGYGMEGRTIDGNNILEVYNTVSDILKDIRKKPRPVLLECQTFRMRGHEEASGTKYVPQELFDEWEKKDPVVNYQNWLKAEGILTDDLESSIRAEFTQELESHLKDAFETPETSGDVQRELADVYAAFDFSPTAPKSSAESEKRFVDAVSDGLRQSMERFDNLVIMGQDIAEYGGVFKITDGFLEAFGKERVRNTPICESAIVSAGMGLSINGMKAVVEMQFADFVSSGFNPIVNYLAKVHYRWGQNADVVVRMPSGAGVGAGPFHSQSNESWFFHTPGLKVVIPSNPYDAKGLLDAAIEDPNPVIFFEHKALYRSISSMVPDDYYTIEIGKANLVKQGSEMTVVCYGSSVHWAKDSLDGMDIDAEIIDLRTLIPLDMDTVKESVKKTGKVLIVHEDTLTGGIGAEISARISEECFEYLDGPVTRVASLDTPVPFAGALEDDFLPRKRLKDSIEALASF